MGTTDTRLFKQNWFMPRIKAACKAGYEIDEEKLIAEFCLFFGSERRTALQFLNQFETLGKIVRLEGRIFTPEAYEAEQILKKSLDVKKEDETAGTGKV